MEVSQSHPVMKAFCGLLLDMMVEGGPAGRKIRDAEEGRDPESQTYPQHITAHLQDGWTLSLLSRSVPDSLLLHAVRDSGKYGAQGDQSSEDSLSLAAAVHAGQQSIPAGLQEALPDPADL